MVWGRITQAPILALLCLCWAFTIPLGTAASAEAVTAAAERGYLGVELRDVTRQEAQARGWRVPQGVVLKKVEPGSPAEAAGLARGDVIVTLNGQRIADADQFLAAIGGKAPGTLLKLRVLRHGRERAEAVKLGARPAPPVTTAQLEERPGAPAQQPEPAAAAPQQAAPAAPPPAAEKAPDTPAPDDIKVRRAESAKQFVEAFRQGKLAEALAFNETFAETTKELMGENSEDYVMALQNFGMVYQMLHRSAEAEPYWRRIVTIKEAIYGPSHPNVAEALKQLGLFVMAEFARLDEAEAHFRRALAIDEAALGPNDPKTAGVLDMLGKALFNAGRYAEAEPIVRRALQVRETANGPGGLSVASSLATLGAILKAINRLEEAETHYRRAVEIYETLPDPSQDTKRAGLLAALTNLDTVLDAQGRSREAEPLARRALAMSEANFGPQSPFTAVCLNNLAETLRRTSRPGEAEPMLRRALEIHEAAYGANHPKVATSLANLALLLSGTGRLPEAVPLAKRAVEIGEKAYGPNHPDVGALLGNLAVILDQTDDPGAAGEYYQRVQEIERQAFGPNHPRAGLAANNLGTWMLARKRYDEAETYFRSAISIGETAQNPEHPEMILRLVNLAALLRETGRLSEAEPVALRALKVAESVLGPSHPETAWAVRNLANLRAAQGDWPGSLEEFRRVNATALSNARGLGAKQSTAKYLRNSDQVFNFQMHALAAFRAAAGENPALLDEAFAMMQRALATEAAGALQQSSQRFAAGSGPLAALLREQQDTVLLLEAAETRLLEAWGRGSKADAGDALQQQARLEARLKQLDAELNGLADYAALTGPRLLTVAGTQELLKPHEVLVLFMSIPKAGDLGGTALAVAISKSGARWVEIPEGGGIGSVLEAKMTAMRCGLDASAWNAPALAPGDSAGERAEKLEQQRWRARCTELIGRAQAGGELPPFGVATAHEVYKALFGGLEEMIGGKDLIIVPSGRLARLPFQTLVTEAPDPALAGLDAYATAKWLGVRQAITVLPSVDSLASLRQGQAQYRQRTVHRLRQSAADGRQRLG